ncbi:hypothetical protein AX17_006560, partial [Amanita inopinata Kibby_2008]
MTENPTTPIITHSPLPSLIPVKMKNAAISEYSSTQKDRDLRIEAMRHEITGRVVGPMPVDKFLDLLPLPKKRLPQTTESSQILTLIEAVKDEKSMYPLWVNAFTGFCPSFELIITGDNAAPNFDGKLIRPDVCLYAKNPGRSQTTDVHRAEIMHEFKLKESADPFNDSKIGFDHNTERAWETLGQITLYATAHMAAQFRSHIFMIFVFSKYARLLRWDRAGVIVTEKLSVDSPAIAEFYWRYCRASRDQRGHDTSVTTDIKIDRSEVRR